MYSRWVSRRAPLYSEDCIRSCQVFVLMRRFSESIKRDRWLWGMSFLVSKVFSLWKKTPHTSSGWEYTHVVSNQNSDNVFSIKINTWCYTYIHITAEPKTGTRLPPAGRDGEIAELLYCWPVFSSRHWHLEKNVNRKHLAQLSNTTGKQYETTGNNLRAIWRTHHNFKGGIYPQYVMIMWCGFHGITMHQNTTSFPGLLFSSSCRRRII